MKNIWTQHLERSSPEDRDKDTTFTRMLHSLVRTGTNTDDFAGTTMILSDISSGDLSYSFEDKKNTDQEIHNGQIFQNNDGIDTSYAAETEIASWAAESQKGHELGIQSFGKDHVKLLLTESGRLVLRYEVAGESSFEMNVNSEDEACEIIEEDNATTEQLYPDNPQLKWIKISLI